MKRKFKIITTGTASLALITPIATVIACGDPKDKGDKMLSLDEARKWIIEGKLEKKGVEIKDAQKAHLKSIFDEFTLKTSKKYETTLNEKDRNGDELTINSLSYMYLIEYSGNGLKLNDYFETKHENPNEDQRDPNEVKEENFEKDNFLKDENIGKYFLKVTKYTNKKTGKILETEGHIFKIDKDGDKIALKGTDLFAMPEKMLSLDELQAVFGKTANQGNEATKSQKAKIKEIFDTFKVEESKSSSFTYEGEKIKVYLYLVSKNGTQLTVSANPGLWIVNKDAKDEAEAQINKYIDEISNNEINAGKYIIKAMMVSDNKENQMVNIYKIIKQADKVELAIIEASSIIN